MSATNDRSASSLSPAPSISPQDQMLLLVFQSMSLEGQTQFLANASDADKLRLCDVLLKFDTPQKGRDAPTVALAPKAPKRQSEVPSSQNAVTKSIETASEPPPTAAQNPMRTWASLISRRAEGQVNYRPGAFSRGRQARPFASDAASESEKQSVKSSVHSAKSSTFDPSQLEVTSSSPLFFSASPNFGTTASESRRPVSPSWQVKTQHKRPLLIDPLRYRCADHRTIYKCAAEDCTFVKLRVKALVLAAWQRDDLEVDTYPSYNWIVKKAFTPSYTGDPEESKIAKAWAPKFNAWFREWQGDRAAAAAAAAAEAHSEEIASIYEY